MKLHTKIALLLIPIVMVVLYAPRLSLAGGGGGSAKRDSRLVRVKNISVGVTGAPLVTLDTVEIADPGNVAASISGSSYGAVADTFRMGKFEVTITQYAAFLNAIAKFSDGLNGAAILSLYDARMASDANVAGISRTGSGITGDPFLYTVVGDGNKPVAYVTWFNAARFANWLHNGATSAADIETGAYTLSGALTGTFTKNPGATWWIPTEDEWFKAAYYKGGGTNAGYWNFPTQSNSFPVNDSSANSNAANFQRFGLFSVTQLAQLDATQNYLTAVGTFSLCPSALGTFDQGGNVDEWTDTTISTGFGTARITRGGAWNSGGLNSDVSPRSSALPTDRTNKIGFRLARSAGAAGTLSGTFAVRVGDPAIPLVQIPAGEVRQFGVRRGAFTVEAQDSVNPALTRSKEFTTSENRTTFIVIDNTGGTININYAGAGVVF